MYHLGSNIMSVFIEKKNPGNSNSEGKRKTVRVSWEFKLLVSEILIQEKEI